MLAAGGARHSAGPRSAGGLRRRRLLNVLLDQAGPSLVVVSAPAGSGKTTLLGQVVELADVPAVHYQATEDECDEQAFVAALGGALAQGLDVPAAAQASDVAGLLAALGIAVELPVLLVMDDLHELADSPAERALEHLVRRHPPAWRLVLGCRRPPLRRLPALRLSEDVLELNADDLRFRSWEVEELFDTIYGTPLPPESVAALTRRTAGWAAGLALFHLATAGMSTAQRVRAVDELGSQSRLLRSYLARDILAELPAQRRQFLIETCALGTLTGPMCDELLETMGSLAVLEELAEEQLFTTCAADGLTFHYHHVLQSHLEVALVEELGPRAARDWYARSAAILERAGHLGEALRAHARAEDWASLGRLLRRTGQPSPIGPAPTWHDLLPPALRDRDPWVAAAEARRQLRQGDLAGATRALRRAEQLSEDRGFQLERRREAALVDLWRGPYLPVPAGRGDAGFRHWSEQVRSATQRAPTDAALDSTTPYEAGARLAAGISALLAGHPKQAAALLGAYPRDPVSPELELCLQLAAALADLLSGASNAADSLRAVLLRADLEDQPWLARQTRALLEIAEGRDSRSPSGLDPLLEDCERHGDAWGAALVRLARGTVGLLPASTPVSGAHDPAADLADAASRFRALHAPVLEGWAVALYAAQLARSGDPAAGRAAAEAERAARRILVPAAGALARAARAETPPRTAPEPARPEVRVTCLGGFGLRVGGVDVDLSGVRPRARTLLRYLALFHGRDVHREQIIDALWPAIPVPAAKRSLHVAVSTVRKAIEAAGLDSAAVVRRRGDAYSLRLPNGGTTDIADLQRDFAGARVARARGNRAEAISKGREVLEAYRGELFPEEGPAEWIVEERERLRLLVAKAARELAADYREHGRLSEAIESAQRAVQLDRWSDRGWQLLSELQERAGDTMAAARSRHEHERVRRDLEPKAAVPGIAVAPTGSRPWPARPWSTLRTGGHHLG